MAIPAGGLPDASQLAYFEDTPVLRDELVRRIATVRSALEVIAQGRVLKDKVVS